MRQLVDPKHQELSVCRQTELLEIPRSNLYYKPVGESREKIEIMRRIDEHHLDHPTSGVLTMQSMLLFLGLLVSHKRIKHLMHLMNIRNKYPQKRLSVNIIRLHSRFFFSKQKKRLIPIPEKTKINTRCAALHESA